MRMFRPVMLLMIVGALGCAGSKPNRIDLPPGARIGILNVLEPQMTHVDIGLLRFDSTSNTYQVDWDLPGFLNRLIEKELHGRGGRAFIPLAVDAQAGWKLSMSNSILSAVNAWMPPELRSYLIHTGEKERLDAIISVSSYNSGNWEEGSCFEIAKNPVATKGYGLFTRTKLPSGLSGRLPIGDDVAAPYANIIVAVFLSRPPALVAFGRAPCSKTTLPNLPSMSGHRSLSAEAIRQLRPHIEKLGAEAVQSALEKASLLP
jgi:hypothetical protein